MSKVPTVLFQRTNPMYLTSHTFITSFLRQLWSWVYYLLIVLCAHGPITLYLLNTERLFFFPAAMGNTNNNLPTGILAAHRILPELWASRFYEGSEGTAQSDASSPGEKQMSSSQEVWPQSARFVNSLLSSQGEKPSPDVAWKTGSQSSGKWVLIHWATVSGSCPKLLEFIRRLQIWWITSNWKLMHNFFKGKPLI